MSPALEALPPHHCHRSSTCWPHPYLLIMFLPPLRLHSSTCKAAPMPNYYYHNIIPIQSNVPLNSQALPHSIHPCPWADQVVWQIPLPPLTLLRCQGELRMKSSVLAAVESVDRCTNRGLSDADTPSPK